MALEVVMLCPKCGSQCHTIETPGKTNMSTHKTDVRKMKCSKCGFVDYTATQWRTYMEQRFYDLVDE